jgi:hypothetical protein
MSIMRSLTLQTNNTIVASGDEVGKLSFAASAESDGLSAISIGARIIAQAEGSFQSSSNPTSLIFATASATAEATGKIKITDNGNVIPMANSAYDIGDQNLQFRNIYASSGNFTSLNTGKTVLTQPASATGSPTAFTLTGAAHTTLTLSTEATDVDFNLSRTVQFATGALTTQRAMRIQAPTYSFVGASTITTASTLSISGPPAAGTFATITNAYALNVEDGNAKFNGNVVLGGGTTSTVGVGSSAEILFGGTSYISTSREGSAYGTQHLGGTYQGCYLIRDDTASAGFGWGSTSSTIVGTPSLILYRDAAGTLAQRNGLNAQTLRVYNTHTSSTSFETLQLKAVASNSFEIATAVGSAGGTTRGLRFGTYETATPSTLTLWAEFVGSTGSFITYAGSNLVYRFGDIATAAVVNYRKARGTILAPTAVLSGDNLLQIQISGHGTSGYTGVAAQIGVIATQTWTDGANGTRMTFSTTATGSTDLIPRLSIENDGTLGFTKAVGWGTETVNTPSGTTQTITLDSANHQTLTLVSATGTVTATLTVPTRGSSSGSIIVKQHASAAKDITWAVSAGTIKWMGSEPNWVADAISSVRIVSWRYDGSVMYLASTDVAV